LVGLNPNEVPDEDEQYAEMFSKILWQIISEELQKRIDTGELRPDADKEAEGNKLINWAHPQVKEYLENELATLDRKKLSHPLIEEDVKKKLEERVEKENLDESVLS